MRISDWTRLGVVIVFQALPAAGEEVLSLSEAVQRALSAHPRLRIAEQRVAAARGVRRQAGLTPNPTFVFQQENLRPTPGATTFWTFTDTFAFLQQTIETGGKRPRRINVAAAGIEQAELELELLRKQIARNVKVAYWTAAGGRRLRELLLDIEANFRLTVDYHDVRVREGAAPEVDLLRVQFESERIKLAASSARLEEETARIGLYRQMGLEAIPETVVYDPLELSGDEAPPADADSALEKRTEMKLARLALRQAEAELRLQQAGAQPNLTAVGGYKRTGGYDSLLAGLQFDLPFRSRNQGNIDAASARIAGARAELAAAAAVVRAEVDAAQKSYGIRRRQLQESLKPMRQRAAEFARIAQAAYREGGSDLLRLIDAERLRIETETLYYRALAEYRQSIVELELALGVEP